MNEAVCHICETEENLSSVEIGSETVFLCPDCRAEHLRQCCDCGEYFIDNDDFVIDAGGDVYCRSCADDHLSFCDKCGEYSNSDNFISIEDTEEWWCQSCAEHYAYCCDNCGEYISENHGDADTCLCNRCYEYDYSTCEDCGELVPNTASVSTNTGTFCRYCYDQGHSDYINNYSYVPFLNFQSSSSDDEKRLAYLGFELEAGGMEANYECKQIAEDIFEDEATFYLKEDGSIPDYGFELVSHPITLKRHKELDWQNILSQMSEAGMKSHDLGEEACGLHVHVSRNYLTPYKWLLIDWFISKYQAQFEIIARRKETHWAQFKKSNGLPVKDVYGKSSGTRYQAVNFENRNTVEFRLFRGTLNYTTFIATLEIVDALVHWANQLSISDILASGDAFGNFTDFIQSKPLYANAAKYLYENKLTGVKKCA